MNVFTATAWSLRYHRGRLRIVSALGLLPACQEKACSDRILTDRAALVPIWCALDKTHTNTKA